MVSIGLDWIGLDNSKESMYLEAGNGCHLLNLSKLKLEVGLEIEGNFD